MGARGAAKGEPGSPTSANAAGTGNTSAVVLTKLQQFAAPAAKGVSVHAAITADTTTAVTTAITNPAIPRSLQVVFSASYDGGNVTVVGTDQFDQAVTETFTASTGATVAGTKIFKTVTSITNASAGAGAENFTVQTGGKLGLLTAMNAAFGMLTCDDAMESSPTWDATYHAVTPATLPNGSRNFTALFPVSHTHTGPSHTHTLS